MPVDLSVIGRTSEPFPIRWSSKDAIIYALGVGAGAQNPSTELAFTTENTTKLPQKVLPTFPVSLGFDAPRPSFGNIDRSRTVHAEQSLVLHEPLLPDGAGHIIRSIDAIYDKGSGALVSMATTLLAEDGRSLATLKSGAFLRGEGGFGGERGPVSEWAAPDRLPDHVVEQPTRVDQALLYRLAGDRNPLHSDPGFAAAGGWPRPILHGLCTYGFVGRAILGLVGFDPARFKSMKVRFSSPVNPGDALRTTFWHDGARLTFRTFVGDRLVLDAGEAEIMP